MEKFDRCDISDRENSNVIFLFIFYCILIDIKFGFNVKKRGWRLVLKYGNNGV